MRLSGGQQQRITLARALVRRTPIICLDEPVSAQDPVIAKRIGENLAALEATTVLASTHSLSMLDNWTHVLVRSRGGGAGRGRLQGGGTWRSFCRPSCAR